MNNNNALYNLRRWRNMRETVRAKNALCQFLDKHTLKQCTNASAVIHHLIDPKDAPEKFFDWANLVAVCVEHHQGGQRGETQGYAYVDTIGTLDAIFRHGHGLPHWHKDYVAPENETEKDLIYRMATSGGW